MLSKLKSNPVASVFRLFALAFAVVLGASPAFATDAAIVLPSSGIDLPGSAATLMTALGLVIAAGIGVALAVVVVRRGLAWLMSGAKK